MMNLLDRVKKMIEKVLHKAPDVERPAVPILPQDVPAQDLKDKNAVSDPLLMAGETPLDRTEHRESLEEEAINRSSISKENSLNDDPHSLPLSLSEIQRRVLEKIVKSGRSERRLIERANMILAYRSGQNLHQIARNLRHDRKTIRQWCRRWDQAEPLLYELEKAGKKISEAAYQKIIAEVLNDNDRSGAPPIFTAEQVTLLYAMACEVLDDSAEGVSAWTHQALADEMVKRGIVNAISSSSVGRLLEEAALKPHHTRYWLNSPEKGTESFEKSAETITTLYQNAATLHEQGVHVISTDEKTGIQAIERLHRTQPMEPEKQPCERREHSYERHGTQTLIANFEVATGQILHPTIGQQRTEKDFLDHIKNTVNIDPKGRWIFIVDQLNIHQSASLVEWVAEHCKITADLGEKGKKGILESMISRQGFLEDIHHQIRFVYTPKHASWLNQIEIWFSILTRRLLRRGSFSSLEQLKTRMLSFIEFFNKTMAKPFKWTYTGRPLTA